MPGSKKYISWRTLALTTFGLVLMGAFAVAEVTTQTRFAPSGAAAAGAMLTDIGSIAFGLLAAASLFFTATRYQRGNPLRQIWLLLGIGIGVYALGDVIWAILEFGSGFKEVPYPSAADVAYLAMYFFMAAGLLRAAKAFRRAARFDVAVAADIILMFLGAVLVYVFVAAPIIVDSSASLIQKVLGVAYPIGDLAVLLGPAVFIAFVASAMRRTQPVRHWWVLAAGLAVMSVSDIAFAWLDWTGRYVSGGLIDYAWMLSLLLIAVSGSLAADVYARRAAQVAPVPVAARSN